jgi:hypothetical protein
MHTPQDTSPLAAPAEDYVRLVLAVGTHDADYVDAYYGPPAWKAETTAAPPSLETIEERAGKVLASLEAYRDPAAEEIEKLRLRYLLCQTRALMARVEMLHGRKFSFDEESRALYDAVAPAHTEEVFEGLLEEVGALLPGAGDIPERFEAHKKDFIIPRERLDRVFAAAIAEGRARSAAHITLPAGEEFSVEYVTGKPWSGYNWYKGGSRSLIQMNVDFPISIDRAVDLACHEGYPGHHVYNSLLEQNLVRARGWVEFSVYALFSPQSLIAEGTANFGIHMAFPEHERLVFEREVLFSLAGLDRDRVEQYYRVHALVQRLAYAGNEAARRYLNGVISRQDAARWLVRYALMSPDRAMQRTQFFDAYRSYVINYNLGQDMVRRYVEAQGGTSDRPSQRWALFTHLISTPQVPSLLRFFGRGG